MASKPSPRPPGAALLVIFNLVFCCPALADALLDRAEQLIRTGQHQQAYELLAKEEADRAGNPDYDLLLGVAALDSGNPSEAVFAFERVLAVQPGNAHARAELARAYFETGENEASKQEFNAVNRQQVPDSIKSAIDQYLSAIESRFANAKRKFNVYLEGVIGYDSNVNSATDSSTVAIPALGNLLFTLDGTGQENDSGFFEVGAGIAFRTPFNNRDDISLFGAANIRERANFSVSGFQSRLADGVVGLNVTRGKNQYRASLQGQQFNFDGDVNRRQSGGNIQWLHAYNERTQFSAFAQVAIQSFPGQKIRNVDQFSGGLGVVHALDREGQPVVFASVFGGTDDEDENTRPDLGRDFVGVRVGGQYTLRPDLNLRGNLVYQYSKYGGDDPLFLERRKDDFLLARVGLTYALTRNWYLLPEVQYINNDSTLPINDFDRWQLYLAVRNNF